MKTRLITSKDNPQIKEVLKLRNRKERDSKKLFIVEGFREVSLALKSSFILKEIFYCHELIDEREKEIVEEASRKGAKIFQVNQKVFLKISYGERKEGILAIAEQHQLKLTDLSLSEHPLVVVVESLEKPGNLGAILRSSDAAGIEAVIVCNSVTDIYNPNCIRASLGAFFSIPVVEETSQNAIFWLKKNKFKIFLATPEAESEYTKTDFLKPSAIVLGSEDKGLSSQWDNAGGFKIKIPMRGRVDSLNVAMAATILIFEALRQRKTN